MTNQLHRMALLGLAACVTASAGGLYLETGNPDANPAAKKLGAVLVARVTACHEPAKSIVTASLVRMRGSEIEHVPLQVQALPGDGATFAVIGKVAGESAVIEMAVTNPQFKDYMPKTLVRVEKGAIQWGSIKRYFSTPPRPDEVKELLMAGGI